MNVTFSNLTSNAITKPIARSQISDLEIIAATFSKLDAIVQQMHELYLTSNNIKDFVALAQTGYSCLEAMKRKLSGGSVCKISFGADPSDIYAIDDYTYDISESLVYNREVLPFIASNCANTGAAYSYSDDSYEKWIASEFNLDQYLGITGLLGDFCIKEGPKIYLEEGSSLYWGLTFGARGNHGFPSHSVGWNILNDYFSVPASVAVAVDQDAQFQNTDHHTITVRQYDAPMHPFHMMRLFTRLQSFGSYNQLYPEENTNFCAKLGWDNKFYPPVMNGKIGSYFRGTNTNYWDFLYSKDSTIHHFQLPVAFDNVIRMTITMGSGQNTKRNACRTMLMCQALFLAGANSQFAKIFIPYSSIELQPLTTHVDRNAYKLLHYLGRFIDIAAVSDLYATAASMARNFNATIKTLIDSRDLNSDKRKEAYIAAYREQFLNENRNIVFSKLVEDYYETQNPFISYGQGDGEDLEQD